MSINQADYQKRFADALTHLQKEISVLRTGRASVQLLDAVRVEAYGSMMSLNEVASITVPDAQLLVIKPWDRSLLGAIEKGIQLAQLNLSPVVDKEIVRVPVPTLTQERRQEMVKTLHQKEEEGRVMIRTIRSDVRRDIEKQEGSAGISEDDIKLECDELDTLVADYMKQIDQLIAAKEAELLKI